MTAFSDDSNRKYLLSLEADILIASDSLRLASKRIIEEEFTDYPIYVATQEESKIGKLLIDKYDFASDWNFYASRMEEFIEMGLIAEEKSKLFKDNYKDPLLYCCLFILNKEYMNFVFVPYREEE